MRATVRIEQRTPVRDAVGAPQATWNLFVERRAEVIRSTGRELEASEQRQGRVPTLFKLRWFEGVLPEMRLVCDDKVFDIESAVDPDQRRRELHITALEHVEAVP